MIVILQQLLRDPQMAIEAHQTKFAQDLLQHSESISSDAFTPGLLHRNWALHLST